MVTIPFPVMVGRLSLEIKLLLAMKLLLVVLLQLQLMALKALSITQIGLMVAVKRVTKLSKSHFLKQRASAVLVIFPASLVALKLKR